MGGDTRALVRPRQLPRRFDSANPAGESRPGLPDNLGLIRLTIDPRTRKGQLGGFDPHSAADVRGVVQIPQ